MEENKKKEDFTINSKIGFINAKAYEAPVAVERDTNDWVRWGEENDYFNKLIDRYIGSATNNRCITGIVDLIYGRGLEATNADEKHEDFARFKQILSDKDTKKLVNDYKLLGQAAAKVVYNRDKTKILSIKHFPMETLRMGKANSKGVIDKVFYAPKWNEIADDRWRRSGTYKQPKAIPTFKNGRKNQREEIYIIKPYRSGYYYYAPVDYQGCVQYAELEEEVSNYHINNIKNGLQPSLIVNFNNGVPNKETQKYLENKIGEKFGGTSNAGKFILSFNDSKEEETSIDPIHLPDAHAQYQFLSDECRDKIMLGHGITSPILFGIKDNTGFGNNAEEIRTASLIMDNTVIRSSQDELLYAFCEILKVNGIELDLYFETLQPIEFTELDNIATQIKREEETGEKLSSVELDDFTDEDGDDMLGQLDNLGEFINEDDWEVVHSEEASGEEFDVQKFAKENRSTVDKVMDFFSSYANPNKKSSQDTDSYKVRYAYMPQRKSPNSRTFCKHLETFTDKNIVFRKEDISQMSFRGVNKELGHNKQNYSLFKFKGGKNCKHYWELRVYKKKVGKNSRVTESNATKGGYESPANPNEISVRPIDMPNNGAYPNK